MFYTEEDVTPAVNQATSIFGRNGVRRIGKNFEHSVTIATRELGKIWFGDVDRTALESNCKMLSERIGQTVYVFYRNDIFDFNSAVLFFNH
jgi:hypothetical protein